MLIIKSKFSQGQNFDLYCDHNDQIVFFTDCRAISVLLGDKWKKMKNDERKAFSLEAKKLAEQYRKQNPDCWKRKRSISEVT